MMAVRPLALADFTGFAQNSCVTAKKAECGFSLCKKDCEVVTNLNQRRYLVPGQRFFFKPLAKCIYKLEGHKSAR